MYSIPQAVAVAFDDLVLMSHEETLRQLELEHARQTEQYITMMQDQIMYTLRHHVTFNN